MLAWRATDHSGDTVIYTPGTGPFDSTSTLKYISLMA
jgi:hypothetical protein